MTTQENKEHELWYFMMKLRLANLQIDVGESLQDAMDLMIIEQGVDALEFESPEKYKHDILEYAHESDMRGEMTSEVFAAMEAVWGDIPPNMVDAEQARLRKLIGE